MSIVDAFERCHACGAVVEVYERTCSACGASLVDEKLELFRRLRNGAGMTPDAFEVVERLLAGDVVETEELPETGVRKQCTELTLDDLDEYPVWEFALDEEGLPGQDEETVRPRPDLTAVDPSEALFLVAARFAASDGTVFRGYVTPSDGQGEAAPTIVTSQGKQVFFWFGIREPTAATLDDAYTVLGKTAAELFPITVAAAVPTTDGDFRLEIEGFAYFDRELTPRLKA